MAQQASIYRSLRPDCLKPVWRCSISLPPSDGRLSVQKWEQIALDFLREMGIPQNAGWTCTRHFDCAHDHTHLTVLRTLPDGSLWNDAHSARRAIKACEKLEQMHNLNTHSRAPAPKDRPTRAEIEIAQRKEKGLPMEREFIQASVDSILQVHPQGIDFTELQKQLASKGIDIQAYAPGGALKGVSYRHGSFKWPGSKIGREYSVGLSERGVKYSADPAATDDVVMVPTPTPAALRPVLPARQGRAPAMLARVLQKNVPQKSPGQHLDEKPLFDLQQSQRQDLGRVSKSLLVLAAALANVGAELALAVIEWVKRFLARLGLLLRPAPAQTYQHSEVGALTYEPVPMLLPDPAEPPAGAAQADLGLDAAVDIIEQVATAVEARCPEALPAEVATEPLAKLLMAEDAGAVGTGAPPAAAAADTGVPVDLDQIFAASQPQPLPAEPASAAVLPARSVLAVLDRFKAALTALTAATAALNKARVPDLPMFFDSRPARGDELAAAVEKHEHLAREFADWKSKNRAVAVLGLDPYGYKKHIAKSLSVLEHHRARAAAAQKEANDFMALVQRTPAPKVPAPVLNRHQAAVTAANKAKAELDALLASILEPIRADVVRAPTLAPLSSTLEALDRRFSRFLADPSSDASFSTDAEVLARRVLSLKLAEDDRNDPSPVDVEDVVVDLDLDRPRG